MSQQGSHYTLRDDGDTFSLLTPPLSRRMWFAFAWILGIAFVGAIVFLVAGLSAPRTLMPHWEEALILYVLVVTVVAVLCWLLASSLAGRQVIEFSHAAIRIRRAVMLGGRTLYMVQVAQYPPEKVSNLRIYPAIDHPRRFDGPFAFDCAGRTVWFGGRLSEREIREIWAELQKRLPDLVVRTGDETDKL